MTYGHDKHNNMTYPEIDTYLIEFSKYFEFLSNVIHLDIVIFKFLQFLDKFILRYNVHIPYIFMKVDQALYFGNKDLRR